MTLKRPVDFDTVREIGLALPNVQEAKTFGMPALKVRGQMLACVPSHRSAEPGSLVVRVRFDDRAALLAENPDIYYVTEHYEGFTGVLVRLSRIDRSVLRDLLGMAHKFVSGETASKVKARNRTKPGQKK